MVEKVREGLSIAYPYLDEKAVLADDPMHLLNSGDGAKRLGNVLSFSPLPGLNSHIGEEATVDGSRVDSGFVPLDDAGVFESSNPIVYRRWSETNRACDLSSGDPRIPLEELEDLTIDLVHYRRTSSRAVAASVFSSRYFTMMGA
jgi:hypothetical protein